MPLARTTRLEVVPQPRVESLPLGPQEYFVLSRVEGRATVAEIIGASGLGGAATEEILERLIAVGVLRVDETRAPAAGAPPRVRQSTQELRAQAHDRRRRVLAQQLMAGRPALEPLPVEPEPEPPQAPEAWLLEARDQAPAVVHSVSSDDPRIDRALALPVDEQRKLLALEDRLEQLDPFELLGLRPTHDLKAIRDAFRDTSRRLHPDAHHGRDLGRFGPVLGTLFARAKAAHAALQKEEVRAPMVDALRAGQEQRELRAHEEHVARLAARKAAQELREHEEQAAAAKRRAARAAQRAERERDRWVAAVETKVAAYLRSAAEAEGMENYARAANDYRLAMELDPSDATIRERWEKARSTARHLRARNAFARACAFVEGGHAADAISLFVEAADADPTVEHLAHAADALRVQNPGRARDLAIAALGLLNEDEKGTSTLGPAVAADLRLMIGRAFLAAGQFQSAWEQARIVQRLRPGDPQAHALLNSAKVT